MLPSRFLLISAFFLETFAGTGKSSSSTPKLSIFSHDETLPTLSTSQTTSSAKTQSNSPESSHKGESSSAKSIATHLQSTPRVGDHITGSTNIDGTTTRTTASSTSSRGSDPLLRLHPSHPIQAVSSAGSKEKTDVHTADSGHTTKEKSPIKSPRNLIEEVKQSLKSECPSCPVCSHLPAEAPRGAVSNHSQSDLDHMQLPTNGTSEDRGFLSFEEWKKSKKAESEAEAEAGKVVRESRRVSSTVSALEKASQSQEQQAHSLSASLEDQGRTYKDRFNYASVDCAATIVKTNSDAKGASSILTEVKDSYLLNKCATPNKFIVIELCQDILVSTVVVGNFELFSSMFRNVRFSVSDRFPNTNGWQELGEFEAQNIRDIQSFEIANPVIWARYLKIEFLTHYGKEFYCPVSVVRVHGTTMIEELKNTDVQQGAASSADDDLKNATLAPPANSSDFAADLEDECKVSPYLALTEFLKDFGDPEFCDVPAANETAAASGAPTNKGTQESIFQNIMKRLSLLESNATLSLLYVEEQSKLLSDAFISLENRQVKKFETMVANFTALMNSQMSYFETVVETIRAESTSFLHSHDLQLTAITSEAISRSQALAGEVSFLRKIVIVDTVIILSVLVYVLVTRETVLSEDLFKREKASRQVSHGNMRPKKKRKNH